MKNNNTNQQVNSAILQIRRIKRYRFLFILILTIVAKLSWGQPFHPYSDDGILVGDGATALAKGDINGDGQADIAVAFQEEGYIDIILSKPGGGHLYGQKFKVTGSPTAIEIGDFNGDHKPDVIVLCLSGLIKVFLNDKLGHFSKDIYLDTPVGSVPSAFAIGDLNGDGNLDAIVTEHGQASIRVMLGTGMGEFFPPHFYGVGILPRSIVITDLNNDGKQDVAVANYETGTVSVLINKGLLGFKTVVHYNMSEKLSKIIAADFNGDGYQDLAVAKVNVSQITVLYGNQDGTFTKMVSYWCGGIHPSSLAAGDLNGDGTPDLLVGNFYSGTTTLLINSGNGFGAATTYNSIYPLVWDVIILDVNADGRLDFVVTDDSNALRVFYQQKESINTAPYQVTNVPDMTATLGQAFSYTVPDGYFSDAETPDKLTYSFSNLPAGISMTSTKTITGTPKGIAGTFQCKIKVHDPQFKGVERSFLFTILPASVTPTKPTGTIPDRPTGRIGAEEPEQEISFDAMTYPNPVTDHFSVEIAGAAHQKVRLLLTDMNGRTLIDRLISPTGAIHQETVEMAQKQTGMYLLKIITRSESKTIKILKL